MASWLVSDVLCKRYVFSFTRANSPSQIYHIPIGEKGAAKCLSSEKVLGIPDEYLSAGEDASYTSYDGLRVSARLYLPSSKLGYKGPRPLVEYVHGPQDRRGQILPGSRCRSSNTLLSMDSRSLFRTLGEALVWYALHEVGGQGLGEKTFSTTSRVSSA